MTLTGLSLELPNGNQVFVAQKENKDYAIRFRCPSTNGVLGSNQWRDEEGKFTYTAISLSGEAIEALALLVKELPAYKDAAAETKDPS